MAVQMLVSLELPEEYTNCPFLACTDTNLRNSPYWALKPCYHYDEELTSGHNDMSLSCPMRTSYLPSSHFTLLE